MPAGYGVGGYDGSGTQGGMDSGMSAGQGEAPENGGGLFGTVKSFVDKVFSGTNQNTQKQFHLARTFCKRMQTYKPCWIKTTQ